MSQGQNYPSKNTASWMHLHQGWENVFPLNCPRRAILLKTRPLESALHSNLGFTWWGPYRFINWRNLPQDTSIWSPIFFYIWMLISPNHKGKEDFMKIKSWTLRIYSKMIFQNTLWFLISTSPSNSHLLSEEGWTKMGRNSSNLHLLRLS